MSVLAGAPSSMPSQTERLETDSDRAEQIPAGPVRGLAESSRNGDEVGPPVTPAERSMETMKVPRPPGQ